MRKIDNFRRNQIISHRGNLNGPNLLLENNPDYIIAASKHCYVEIDVWYKTKAVPYLMQEYARVPGYR